MVHFVHVLLVLSDEQKARPWEHLELQTFDRKQ